MEQTPGGEQTLGEHREEQGGVVEENTYSTPRRYHRGMARQCPRGHDGIKPREVIDDTSAYHVTRRAPGLAEEKARQLEIKLEVAMAKIQSFRGKGDESVQGAIDKILRIGRSVVA
jgi:hypothetical protein